MATDKVIGGEIEISDPSRLPEKPVVSVFMLTYNHGPYLAEAIDGVLKQQTDFPIELLIGEDCSTDNTREIALRYQRANPDVIRVIISTTNVGAGENRLRLTRAIRGEFIALCEGDDYWTDPAKLQRQVDYLRAHADVGAVHSDFDHIIFRRGRWRKCPHFLRYRLREPVPEGDIFPILLRANFIQTCTLCIRTELDQQFLASDLAKVIYPVGDWPLCLYIAAKRKIAYLPQSTAVYREVPGSVMNSGHASRARIGTAYISMIEGFCDRFAVAADARINALSGVYGGLMSLAVFANDPALYERARIWLAQNDPDYLKPLRRRLLPYLMRSVVSRWVLLQISEARVRLREIRRYR